MSDLVILSPHFDDAVLSCGGQLWQAWGAGAAVRVVTLFAGGPQGEPPPFAQEQHRMWGAPPDANALRRAEDRAALARLGVGEIVHLDAPDAVYRRSAAGRALYESVAAIFGPIDPEEGDVGGRLLAALRPQLLPGALLVAPLGVGHHVDHQWAHRLARSLHDEGQRVAFYEELPYVERHAAQPPDGAAWRLERLPLSEAALAAKVAAMAYYRSQIPVLYGDEARMGERIRAVARAAAAGAGYAERRWWPG